MSSASVEGAKANLAAEVPGWDFESVLQDAKKGWNSYLAKVKIEGSEDDKVNFYTSMYHLYIQPNNIAVKCRNHPTENTIPRGRSGILSVQPFPCIPSSPLNLYPIL